MPLVITLAAIALVVAVLVLVDVIAYAYQRVGLDRNWLFAALAGSIIGSRVDLPVARFPDRSEPRDVEVTVFGIRYRAPDQVRTGTTVLAVNVGGALIPAALSGYLVVHDGIWLHSLIAVAVVSGVVWAVARPVPGVGIVTPTLVPPLAAALVAICLGGPAVAALAYVSGVSGTLIGADLINIPRIRDLGAGVASIGGAGTFDGIFLTGILAVVLAGL
jgi:uncharacterized membrane protein